MGRWINRDPIGETNTVNLYQFVSNRPNNSTDTIGLFEMLNQFGGRNLWRAEKGDTHIGRLAVQIGASPEDWQCIWPVEMKYPEYYERGWVSSDCDVFDVQNLITTTGSSLRVGISPYDHERYKSTFDSSNDKPLEYVYADNIPEKLKNVSGEGATPIEKFLIAGHGAIQGKYWNPRLHDFQQPYGEYKLDDILLLSQPPSFERASNRRGPVRCWFTRNALTIFYGCTSKNIAEPFAEKVLRKGAISWGTNQTTGTSNRALSYNHQAPVPSTVPEWWTATTVWEKFYGKL